MEHLFLLSQVFLDRFRFTFQDLSAHVDGLQRLLDRSCNDRRVDGIEERLNFTRCFRISKIRQAILNERNNDRSINDAFRRA